MSYTDGFQEHLFSFRDHHEPQLIQSKVTGTMLACVRTMQTPAGDPIANIFEAENGRVYWWIRPNEKAQEWLISNNYVVEPLHGECADRDDATWELIQEFCAMLVH